MQHQGIRYLFSLLALGSLLLLPFCGGQDSENETGGAVTISLACGAVGEEFEICKRNAEEWAQQTGNRVNMHQTPNSSTERLALFQQILAAKGSEIDVFQIDVIWPGLLGKNFLDLNQYIDKEHSSAHFNAIVENNTDAKGRLLAMPFFTDAGLLFYRTDLLEKHGRTVPKTWEEMTESAKYILGKEKAGQPKLLGFVFQGRAYEGLTCNALEWIDSYGGGSIIDVDGNITINNPNAIAALKMAASWVGDIAPKGVLNYAEEEARGVFQSGNAIFMRNWPYAWSLSQGDDSPIKGKVGVAPLPKGGANGKHTGTLGGWNMSVSKYSKHPKEAADLVRHLTTTSIQVRRAIEGSYNPTIMAAYKDEALGKKNPFMVRLYGTFTNAVARPSRLTGRKYNKVSNKFWNAVYSAISGQETPEKALSDLEIELNAIKGGGW